MAELKYNDENFDDDFDDFDDYDDRFHQQMKLTMVQGASQAACDKQGIYGYCGASAGCYVFYQLWKDGFLGQLQRA